MAVLNTKIVATGIELFGDQEKFIYWFLTPIKENKNYRPIDLQDKDLYDLFAKIADNNNNV